MASITLMAPAKLEADTLTPQVQSRLALWDNWLLPFLTTTLSAMTPAMTMIFSRCAKRWVSSPAWTPSLSASLPKIADHDHKGYPRCDLLRLGAAAPDGEAGLADGLELLVALMQRFGEQLHPQRERSRKAALEWLGSSRMLDSLSLYPEVIKTEANVPPVRCAAGAEFSTNR
jgi:type VI secretion system protein VasJ